MTGEKCSRCSAPARPNPPSGRVTLLQPLCVDCFMKSGRGGKRDRERHAAEQARSRVQPDLFQG